MATQHKENNFSIEAKKDLPNIKKAKTVRPNIDHLIKKILTERRKEQQKNSIVFVSVLLVIAGSIFFLN
jgi:hypothetical protein|tara:strand:- start:71 stop:277 length:207 start_codon:yes stop_codon:yes gene_type:complete